MGDAPQKENGPTPACTDEASCDSAVDGSTTRKDLFVRMMEILGRLCDTVIKNKINIFSD
jgi:hypothetical protein